MMLLLHRIDLAAQLGQGKLGIFIALGSHLVACRILLLCCWSELRSNMHTSTRSKLTRHLPEDLGLGQKIVGIFPVIHAYRDNQVAFDAMISGDAYRLSVRSLRW